MAASASDAHPYPIFNARFRVTFPILDADGDLVTGAAGLDSEASQNQGTFADCTNEATEIATSSGMYYLDLIATELDTQQTAVIIKTSTSGGKTTPMVLYPKRLPLIRAGTAQAGAASTITLDSGASAVDTYYVGCYVNVTNDSPSNVLGQARLIIGYVGSTKVATVEGTYGTNPSSASTFEVLATDLWIQRLADVNALLGVAVATPTIPGVPEVDVTHLNGVAQSLLDLKDFADDGYDPATNKVQGVVLVDTLTTYTGNTPQTGDSFARLGAPAGASVSADISSRASAAALATVQADTDDIQTRLPAALVGGRIDASVGAMAAGTVTAAAVATDAIDADALAASAVTEIQAGLATPTNITAGTITTVTNLTNAPTAGDLTAAMKAAVNAEVVDALNVDTYAEPGQGIPAATTTLVAKIGFLYKAWRNRSNQTATAYKLFNDDAVTVDQKSTVSDDATTFESGEKASGP